MSIRAIITVPTVNQSSLLLREGQIITSSQQFSLFSLLREDVIWTPCKWYPKRLAINENRYTRESAQGGLATDSSVPPAIARRKQRADGKSRTSLQPFLHGSKASGIGAEKLSLRL
jgi:hypothetical protein